MLSILFRPNVLMVLIKFINLSNIKHTKTQQLMALSLQLNTLRLRQNYQHLQKAFCNAFSWMKILKFCLKVPNCPILHTDWYALIAHSSKTRSSYITFKRWKKIHTITFSRLVWDATKYFLDNIFKTLFLNTCPIHVYTKSECIEWQVSWILARNQQF